MLLRIVVFLATMAKLVRSKTAAMIRQQPKNSRGARAAAPRRILQRLGLPQHVLDSFAAKATQVPLQRCCCNPRFWQVEQGHITDPLVVANVRCLPAPLRDLDREEGRKQGAHILGLWQRGQMLLARIVDFLATMAKLQQD